MFYFIKFGTKLQLFSITQSGNNIFLITFVFRMKELSILIPTFNDPCYELAKQLCKQAEALSLNYELLVVDDGSTDISVVLENQRIASLGHCQYLPLRENCGRAYVRNYLASKAKNEWLLFIDADMVVHHEDFLKRYIDAEGDVIDGGVEIGPLVKGNLRSIYEHSKAHEHTLEKRQQDPYHDFHTANFMIHRDVMNAHPFDQRFRYYGYEDVFLGKQLMQAGVKINHIDNPLSFEIYEDNDQFIRKTEEGLRTLFRFRNDLKDFSRIISFVEKHPILSRLVWLWHEEFSRIERRILTGKKPRVGIFALYRLGFYIRQVY